VDARRTSLLKRFTLHSAEEKAQSAKHAEELQACDANFKLFEADIHAGQADT
jgi:hypothetical protein